MTFAEKLQRLRKQNGLSQEQLAEKLNVSRQAVSKWEMGTIPDMENMVKLGRYFDCSLDYLMKDEVDDDNDQDTNNHNRRAGAGRVIVEGFVQFDYEITQLTVRHSAGTTFLKPVGHVQVDGDYRESWQPQVMSEKALQKAQDIARKVTDALGGYGIFGVELFIKGDDVLFSEVSPRPHDTGMVTMISQDMSQFALHARAVLGLPVPGVRFYGPSASRAIVVEGDTDKVVFGNLDEVLSEEGVQMRIFGKPEVVGHRRLGVILATADTVEEARAKADRAYKKLKVKLLPR